MKKHKILSQLSQATCYFLAFLFTYTGISKLIDHDLFLSSILQSPIIRNWAITISWLVPVIELLIVALLLSDKYRYSGLLFSLFLMTSFTFYIAYMMLFIENLPCSCGGVLKVLTWGNHILLNCFLMVLILISLLSIPRDKLFIAINRTSPKPV